MRAATRTLRRKQTPKEENTQPSRKLVQGRQVWRSVSRSTLLSGGTFGNAIRRPCSARTEEREISRTVRGDVSIVRLHRSSFNGITLSATKGHTLLLNAPWTEHDCGEVCFKEYLTKVGNPKVASPKMRRADKSRPAASVKPAPAWRGKAGPKAAPRAPLTGVSGPAGGHRNAGRLAVRSVPKGSHGH
jgi:hypothetical protein